MPDLQKVGNHELAILGLSTKGSVNSATWQSQVGRAASDYFWLFALLSEFARLPLALSTGADRLPIPPGW